ncbi:MAG TPA: transporter substrate-binding domain-containing protein [Candidatus Baltobacteraceae bacterium]|nr:transporter substrate-binding domain-containing protein [Candidatus Baltobacteraceae bacterium]
MRTRGWWGGALAIACVIGLLVPALGLAGEATPAAQAGTDTLQQVIKKGELTVGTFDFYPPWGFRDAQNNIVGMDVDVAKELAGDDVLKVKLTLVPVPTTQDRINFLLSGKIDVAISNFTATLPRAKVIDFTDPYVVDGVGVIFRKDLKIGDWKDLNNKRVAVTTGSTGEILVKKLAPQAKLLQFDQASTALLAVQQNKADAQIEDYTYTVYHAGRDKNLAFLNKPLDFQPYCFGVRKFDQEWLNYLNFFIYRLQQSGKMKALYKQWFGAEPFHVSPTW